MNISRLLSQVPFNKWVTSFLNEYTKNCGNVYISKIGSRAFTTDTEIVNMFLDIMVQERPGAFLPISTLEQLFYAWYSENAAYHTNYRPPKMELLQVFDFRYDRGRERGVWGYKDVGLVVSTIEETIELVADKEQHLQYQLPDFIPEMSKEEYFRRMEPKRMLGEEEGGG